MDIYNRAINYFAPLTFLIFLTVSPATYADNNKLVVDLEQTVVKLPLEEGVSLENAVESMKLRANILNIKLVAELPLSKQIQAMGQKSGFIGIYQFCEPLTAKKMVEYDMNFAAYLPCRISAVEDKNGKGWLLMMNMEMLLNNPKLNKDLRAEAEKVWKNLVDIMKAGAAGDL